jgi:hypothetical protein
MQKAITGLFEDHSLSLLLSNPGVTKSTIQRLNSGKSKNAGAWKNALPKSVQLQMFDDEFMYAYRFFLGLPPHDDLPPFCDCGASILDDPCHYWSCQLLKRGPMTVRHDWLRDMLALAFRLAGAYVQVEHRPMEEARTRPDLWVTFSDQSLFVDVVVSHPSSPSRVSLEPLAATKKAEQSKVTTYEHIARAKGARILAFAVESYGAFGKHATDIIQLIRHKLRYAPGQQDAAHDDTLHALLPQQLAVSLQKGNAMVACVGSLRARRAAARLR